MAALATRRMASGFGCHHIMAALATRRVASGFGCTKRLYSQIASPFFSVDRWDKISFTSQATLGQVDKGPNKYALQVHHPNLPGNKPSPADRDVYKSKLRVGALVLIDRSALEDSLHTWAAVDAKGTWTAVHGYAGIAMSYGTSFYSVVGILQGPGAKPHTKNVLQAGDAGERLDNVPEDAITAGARQRIIMDPAIQSKDLEWEVRLMWPSILQKVSFEVGGKVQEGHVFINEIRAGKLVARLTEEGSDKEIVVPCKADPSYKPTFFESLLKKVFG